MEKGRQREKEREDVRTKQHVPVSLVGSGVDVRRHLVTLFPLVHVDDLLCVDREPFVRVDHHAEQPRVRLRRGKERGTQGLKQAR